MASPTPEFFLTYIYLDSKYDRGVYKIKEGVKYDAIFKVRVNEQKAIYIYQNAVLAYIIPFDVLQLISVLLLILIKLIPPLLVDKSILFADVFWTLIKPFFVDTFKIWTCDLIGCD